jgi:isoleucyl-tRNA synthetase
MVSFVRETPEHVLSSEFTDGAVYVDTERDDALEADGYANEIVRRIQQLRKELDLDIDAKIRTSITVDDEGVEALLDDKMDHIATETRSAEIVDSLADPAASVSETIHGVPVTIGVEPAA